MWVILAVYDNIRQYQTVGGCCFGETTKSYNEQSWTAKINLHNRLTV